MYRKLWCVIILVLLIPTLLAAATTGKIRGKVFDRETKEPLPMANVMIVGTSIGAAADINGEFIILNVPVGSFALKASFVGYRDVVVNDVRVSVNLTTSQNFGLPSEAIEGETVTIVAERPLVNKNETHEIHTFEAEKLEQLPLRGTAAALNVLPGVINDDGIHVRGGRSTEMAYYVDGMNVTLPSDGSQGLSVIHNSIEEISYHAGGFGAEFGGRMSGQLLTTLKSGTPNYHFGMELISDDFWAVKSETEGYRILGLDKVYSYGYDDYIFWTSGPVPGVNKLKFYLAGQRYWRHGDETQFEGFSEAATLLAPGRWVTSGKDAGRVILDTLSLGMNFAPGRIPGGGNAGWTINGNFNLDLNPFQIKFGGTFNTQQDQAGANQPIDLLTLPARNYLNKRGNYSAYFNLSHVINTTTYYTLMLNYMNNYAEFGDPLLGWTRADWPTWGDPVLNPALLDTGYTRTFNVPGSFTVEYPNTPVLQYGKDNTDVLGAKFDFTKQIGSAHDLKIGGEFNYYTIRRYRVDARRYLLRQATAASLVGTANYLTDYDFYRGLNTTFMGYDIHGETEMNDDEFYPTNVGGQDVKLNAHNAPGRPVFAGAYIRDLIELKDLIINAGLRLDYIDNGVPGYKDLQKLSMGTASTIDETNYTANKTFTYVTPRLGFSFPVTDAVIFHAQYGKYVQPTRTDLRGTGISSYGPMLINQYIYGGGFAVQVPNPNLKPERQTSYEFGFKQAFSNIASLDVTAFYKDTRDLTTMRVVFPQISDYRAPYFNMNEDFGTVKGLSFTFNLRRTQRIAIAANYTYSDAKGTGSEPRSHFDIAWTESSPQFPVVIGPLDFDQRHKGWLDFDLRFQPDDGPILWGMKPLAEVGLNLSINFNSGSPFTRTAAEYGAEGVFTYNAPQPLEGYNVSTLPWFYQMDLKLEKGINVGPVKTNIYLWVMNLLNTKSVTNMWRATGRPDDNGWLATEQGQTYIRNYGETGVKWYQAMLTNCGTYGWQAPRVIRGGLKLEF